MCRIIISKYAYLQLPMHMVYCRYFVMTKHHKWIKIAAVYPALGVGKLVDLSQTASQIRRLRILTDRQTDRRLAKRSNRDNDKNNNVLQMEEESVIARPIQRISYIYMHI